MKTLIHPAYFPSVAHFVSLVNSEVLIFEAEDNYQKQTYRNRMYIYGANGKQSLTVPIKHTGENRQKYKDVRLEHSFNWQKQHWKSIQTAYRTSPFFEFYEDELAPVFEKKHEFLMDLNFKTIELISDILQTDLQFEKTTLFEKQPENINDLRWLIEAKREPVHGFETYTQVFGDKHGFLENLSILDLIFNEGPNSSSYLENQKIKAR
ncbi:hypothetical protein GWK08_01670 [Leptobacterium flavescens]|uniref:WbqC family protein n=1 Tax=Leptobacterium flavescens TaxID=472055 RepID=A0A6P0UGJ3_9FLAO|nr:WbqC family protein [Leptobacterium flavescens]NER12137.1 hypothetical protein [Leptobacterium flavescens]